MCLFVRKNGRTESICLDWSYFNPEISQNDGEEIELQDEEQRRQLLDAILDYRHYTNTNNGVKSDDGYPEEDDDYYYLEDDEVVEFEMLTSEAMQRRAAGVEDPYVYVKEHFNYYDNLIFS